MSYEITNIKDIIGSATNEIGTHDRTIIDNTISLIKILA